MPRWTFDATSPHFRKHAENAGHWWKTGREGSKRQAFILDHSRGQAEFCADPYFTHSAQGLPYSDAEIAAQWRCVEIVRDHLQTCWLAYLDARAAGL